MPKNHIKIAKMLKYALFNKPSFQYLVVKERKKTGKTDQLLLCNTVSWPCA